MNGVAESTCPAGISRATRPRGSGGEVRDGGGVVCGGGERDWCRGIHQVAVSGVVTPSLVGVPPFAG